MKKRLAKPTRARGRQAAERPRPKALAMRPAAPHRTKAGVATGATPRIAARPIVTVAPPKRQQMILLPTRGLRANTPLAAPGARLLTGLHTLLATPGSRGLVTPKELATLASRPRFEAPGFELRVLDSIAENGAKLIEISPASLPALRAVQPGLRVVPLRYYRPQNYRVTPLESVPTAARAAAGQITAEILSKADGSPVPRAVVVAFTDFEGRQGAQGTTDTHGRARLRIPPGARLERIYVYPEMGFWSGYREDVRALASLRIELEGLRLDYVDGLRHWFGNGAEGAGTGVTVGVLDTGVGPHPDLVLDGGRNTVVGEDPSAFTDNGEHHGTHVAGIIAARGLPPKGVRGVAPAVRLRSYRVFGKGASGASNYAIAKAIDAAHEDGCDLINMSLGQQKPPGQLDASDEALVAALEDARGAGMLSVAAAGNDGRQPVSFPALDPTCVAVSALGRKGTFPKDTTETGDVAPPYGTDKHDFVAAFSNIGPELDLGAAGVGIISTVPEGYAVMSGTSMAAPVATGLAARLLASRPDIRSQPREAARAAALAQALAASARSLGFAPLYVGRGMPQ